MIYATDQKIVEQFQTWFGLAPSRMIFGTLEEAKNYWVRNNPDDPGVESLPYLAFTRSFDFAENRHVQTMKMRTSVAPDYDGAVSLRYTPIILVYNIDLITETRKEQVDAIRSYMFWANESPVIQFTDDTTGGTTFDHKFAAIGDPPEDNSDLEAEEESGRIVRTSFSLRVESYLMDISTPLTGGAIQEILGQVHLYDGLDLSNAVEATNPDGSTPLIETP